jgi:hypothetical protein
VTKTVVITQSNYIPWRGYFDMLRSADEIVLLDSVQYTKRDWRNRNQIKTGKGPLWLTIPVEVKGRYFQAIDETRIADSEWATKHIRAIEGAYAGAVHFKEIAPWLFRLVREAAAEPLLSSVNTHLLQAICEILKSRKHARHGAHKPPGSPHQGLGLRPLHQRSGGKGLHGYGSIRGGRH